VNTDERDLLQNILQCPVCGGRIEVISQIADKLAIWKGRAICLGVCEREYPIHAGIIDMRVDDKIRKKFAVETGWDIKIFENVYAKLGYVKDYYDWVAPGNIPKIVANYRYTRTRGRLLDWLNLKGNELVLDLGCGSGWVIFKAMERYPEAFSMFVGLDVSWNMIKWLSYRKKEEEKENVAGILGEAEFLPFRDSTFDFVLSSEVIEHLYSPLKGIKETARVLNPGGKLFISTPSKEMYLFWEKFFLIPRIIKRVLERKFPLIVKGEEGYDEPLRKRELMMYLRKAQLVYQLEHNNFLPHESYFQHFPGWVTRSIVKIAEVLEEPLKHLLPVGGLTYLVRAQKSVTPKEGIEASAF